MRASIRSSLMIALLAGVSLPALAQTEYSVTSPSSGITTTVRSAELPKETPQITAPAATPAPALPAAVPAPATPAKGMAPILSDKDLAKDAAKKPAAPQAPLVVTAQPQAVPAEPAPAASAPAPSPAMAAPEPAPAVVMPVSEPQPAATSAAVPQISGAKIIDILSKAYTDSPVLRAEREVLRQQYENVSIAESLRRPGVTVNGGVGVSNTENDPGGKDNLTPYDIGITGTQYLYRGGRTLAQIEQQLKLSDAALAAYDAATQDVLMNVVTAAMDIQRARVTIELTEQNRTVIARSLESARNGFRVGELTRTDVAQAQARLSGADATLVAARADYSSALARFMQYAGMDGSALRVSDDATQAVIPGTLDAAKTLANDVHPLIRSAVEQEKASQSGIELARGALRPDVYAQATAGKAWEQTSLIDSTRDATIALRASLPLYDGGASRAQIRQAKYQQMEKRDRIEDARRAVTGQVATAWNNYEAAIAQIGAREQQVEAANIAREGVYNERQVGTRTVLDTLNADAELLDAQVGLVSARRDAVVAAFALQAATGQLTGEKLGLFSTDSEKAQRDKARKTWLSTDVQPVQ